MTLKQQAFFDETDIGTLISENQSNLEYLKNHFVNILDKIDPNLFVPIVVIGKSGVGKDTILDYLIPFLNDNFGINIKRSKARYLTRPMRPGEEGSENNFVLQEEFNRQKINYKYENSGFNYGINEEKLKKEGITVIINNEANALDLLHHSFQDLETEPFVIELETDRGFNVNNLVNRPGSEEEKQKRLEQIKKSGGDFGDMKQLLFNKSYINSYKIDRSFDDELNNEYFKSAIYKISEDLLNHIIYINYAHKEGIDLVNERIKTWVEHIQNRP